MIGHLIPVVVESSIHIFPNPKRVILLTVFSFLFSTGTYMMLHLDQNFGSFEKKIEAFELTHYFNKFIPLLPYLESLPINVYSV